MSVTDPSTFRHIDRMCDHRGLFEHAAGTERRIEHGYCTDDNARLLVVTSREPDGEAAIRLGRLALHFVRASQGVDGRCRNRMDRTGRWTDKPSTDDCWGRSVWGLGSAAAHHSSPAIRRWARRGFDIAIRQRSRWPRAMAFAALGAADVAIDDPINEQSRALLIDVVRVIGAMPSSVLSSASRPVAGAAWHWPEPRLSYANASLAEAMIAAGAALEDDAVVERGLAMLAWLLELETPRGHLSVAGVGGRGPRDHGPMFDQQPIEVAAMADACWRAFSVTGDTTWSRGVAVAAGWFHGDNDTGLQMYDDVSGGGYDGLHADRVNMNQGAESTLALISTMQRARSFAPAR
jgi:hypothetical protein